MVRVGKSFFVRFSQKTAKQQRKRIMQDGSIGRGLILHWMELNISTALLWTFCTQHR